LLSFSQDGHKGNGPEWSLGAVIIRLVVSYFRSNGLRVATPTSILFCSLVLSIRSNVFRHLQCT